MRASRWVPATARAFSSASLDTNAAGCSPDSCVSSMSGAEVVKSRPSRSSNSLRKGDEEPSTTGGCRLFFLIGDKVMGRRAGDRLHTFGGVRVYQNAPPNAPGDRSMHDDHNGLLAGFIEIGLALPVSFIKLIAVQHPVYKHCTVLNLVINFGCNYSIIL